MQLNKWDLCVALSLVSLGFYLGVEVGYYEATRDKCSSGQLMQLYSEQ